MLPKHVRYQTALHPVRVVPTQATLIIIPETHPFVNTFFQKNQNYFQRRASSGVAHIHCCLKYISASIFICWTASGFQGIKAGIRPQGNWLHSPQNSASCSLAQAWTGQRPDWAHSGQYPSSSRQPPHKSCARFAQLVQSSPQAVMLLKSLISTPKPRFHIQISLIV